MSKIYCNWVGCEVDEGVLSKHCKPYFKEGRCDNCPTSPQIKQGMAVEKLLEYIKD